MTPDDLWEKHLHNDMYATKAGFFAALQEYGEAVRKQAVSVCRELDDNSNGWNRAFEDCAAAIEKMELP
jgi:hypothetical protein